MKIVLSSSIFNYKPVLDQAQHFSLELKDLSAALQKIPDHTLRCVQHLEGCLMEKPFQRLRNDDRGDLKQVSYRFKLTLSNLQLK